MGYFFHITKPIKPTDVKVYYEDGHLYLDYRGVTDTDFGKAEIHIAKMSLNIHEIEDFCEYYNEFTERPALVKCQCYVSSREFYDIKILEKDMTKKEIEKELGYKINIKEE